MNANKLNNSGREVPLAFGVGEKAAPTDRAGLTPRNRLLASLPQEILASLRPHLRPVRLPRGRVLCEAGDSRWRVYFVESGVVSLVTGDRASVTAATVGREGAVGGPTVLLGGGLVCGRYQMLVPGSALVMEAPQFRIALQDTLDFRSLCEVYTQAFFVQVLQNLACGKLHTAEQRSARWLLMCDDQTEDDACELGADSLAAMLGVPPSVGDAVASRLQEGGLIHLRQGSITVLDRRQLEATACVCYRIVRHYYERLGDHYYDRPLAQKNT
jgi:CRP-like cAMP-binding protein